MSLTDQVQCAVAARQFVAMFPPNRVPSLETLRGLLKAQEARRVQLPQYSTEYAQRVARQERSARQRSEREHQALTWALRQGLRHLARQQDPQAGSALNVRIPRVETEREQGMGL